jgi:cyclopropane-fatty-acyl-phospholipid synthase
MRRIILDPRLGAAESFMDGDMRIEGGDIMDLIGLIRMNTPWDRGATLKDKTWLGRRADWVKTRLGSINRQRQSRANVRHHYDIGNDLYRLFLDDDMQYSCAYWPRPDMSLDEAQLAKRRHVTAKLLVKPDQRVLDIGSGWGGLGLYIAEIAGGLVTGVTLSNEQFEMSNQRAKAKGMSERAKFLLEDYRKIPGPFDRIVSVGMFEHVGIDHYQTYFDRCAKLLKDDGVMVLHAIGRSEGPDITNPWVAKYIFPGGYIPALSEVLPRIERSGLLVNDIEILRLHYADTLKAWHERFLARREEAAAINDERIVRMWRFYLASSEMSFRKQNMMVFQIQLSKRQGVVPITRDYIAQEEQRLRSLEAQRLQPLQQAGE